MISVFSLRRPRFLLLILVPVNLFLLACALIYLEKLPADISTHKEAIHSGFKSLTNNFDFSYLTGDASSDASAKKITTSLGGKIDTFKIFGYQIIPKRVRFQFINSKNKVGNPEQILKTNEDIYNKVIEKEIGEPKDFNVEAIRAPENPEDYVHANATIIALVRNHEAQGIILTIKRFEKSFNNKFNYPYTFINDEPFSDRFKKRLEKYTSAPLNFVVIPPHLWNKPEFIDTKREKEAMKALKEQDVAYADKDSYHNMCRFYLGNFYNVPELQKYKYYWRIEPHVDYYTDIKYDVFKYLEKTGKIYGFTINLYDIAKSVPTLWPETLRYLNSGENYKYVNENGAFQWLLENQQNPKNNKIAEGFSTCHFWSNFEIADMDFFRGEAYNNWFKFLDSTGKFYYERWGDAPVHSIGLALFADKKKIHWFRDIGYFHDPYFHCPNSPATSRCKVGKFSKWEHLADQNCMATWIDYSINDLDAVY